VESTPDRALAYAKNCLRHYKRVTVIARLLNYGSDLGLLAASAATFTVAGLHAPAVVTSVLALATFVLAGFRRLFRPGETWVRVATAYVDIERTLVRYENVPEQDRTEQARSALLDKVGTIRLAEHYEWVAFQRRALSEEPAYEHPTGGSNHGLPHRPDGPLT
jgi:hypothetical protein